MDYLRYETEMFYLFVVDVHYSTAYLKGDTICQNKD